MILLLEKFIKKLLAYKFFFFWKYKFYATVLFSIVYWQQWKTYNNNDDDERVFSESILQRIDGLKSSKQTHKFYRWIINSNLLDWQL